jgi:isopenicillin N synthase-like dioxygenase
MASSNVNSIGIPTIDLAESSHNHAAVVEAVRQACLHVGFFYLTGHGIDCGPAVLEQSKLLFALPEVEKRALSDATLSRGYTAWREETLDPAVQTMGDTKEGFYISVNDIAVDDVRYNPAKLAGPNQWPNATDSPSLKDPQQFQTVMRAYMEQVTQVAIAIVRLIAESLELDAHYFDHAVVDCDPLAVLRLLHYEATRSDVDRGIYACGAHTDYGLVTLLWTDENDGLQILDQRGCGEWIHVPTVPNCLVVNLGDMLERWTNGMYCSTLHRVVNTSGRERYSVPFFFEPAFDTVVECLPGCCSLENPAKYPPTTSGEHLLSKYRATHADFEPVSTEKPDT